MKVAYYAPMPPARTGVADYAAALLAALRRHGAVEPHARGGDVALYHLGNNQLHREIYRRALEQPGVVVLHDAVLHHFFLGALSRPAYIDEFVYNYGEWHRALAHDLWRARANSGFDRRYFDYPMLKRIAERSRALVVHNPAAARMVRQHAPGAAVIEIPHLFAPPELPAAWEAIRMRHSLGVPAHEFLFGVFGYLRESKRLFAILRAFHRLRQSRPDARLLIAGPFVSSDLERAAAPLLAGPGILRLPYLAERDFWRAAMAVDACINLRYPAAGETSGIAIRLMGVAKPVLLTAGEENSRYSATACLRVEPGLVEEDSLWHNMFLLLSVKECAGEIGLRASGHIVERHQAVQIAQQYWDTLCAFR
ncbi:MAG: glycosyltransferase [Bryobacteraceae bacterium]|jgi:glycosyltransferase involved in cell wall biosynthesis